MYLNDYYNGVTSILILDYNKPKETEVCLQSIKDLCSFKKHVMVYSNGGDQEYLLQFYKNGLIDQLVLNRENKGCGIGTIELFKACPTKYAIYFQNDQAFLKPYTQNHITELIASLDQEHDGQTIKSISLAGMPCGPLIYSERAHFIEVEFYNGIEGKTIGGPGPFNDVQYSEQSIQNHYKDNSYIHAATPPVVCDNGVYSVRELKGGKLKWRTDTKQLWVLDTPTEKIGGIGLSDEDWELVLSGKFINGNIPESWKEHSFQYWEVE